MTTTTKISREKAIKAEIKKRLKDIRTTTTRENLSRMFFALSQDFTGYRSDVATRRKYLLTHHRLEYRQQLSNIRRARRGGVSFFDASGLNCSSEFIYNADRFKPSRQLL